MYKLILLNWEARPPKAHWQGYKLHFLLLLLNPLGKAKADQDASSGDVGCHGPSVKDQHGADHDLIGEDDEIIMRDLDGGDRAVCLSGPGPPELYI